MGKHITLEQEVRRQINARFGVLHGWVRLLEGEDSSSTIKPEFKAAGLELVAAIRKFVAVVQPNYDTYDDDTHTIADCFDYIYKGDVNTTWKPRRKSLTTV